MRRNKIGICCIVFGLMLTVLAASLAAYNHYVQIRAVKASEGILKQLVPIQVTSAEETKQYIENRNILMPVVKVRDYDCIGVIEIPSIGVKLPVLSEWDYRKLRVSPCRYAGSVYQNNLIICAHDYRKHFGKIKSLSIGDSVTFTDMYGNIFSYKVCELETVSPKSPETMIAGNWDLTLFTCTTGGSARMTVRCVREITHSSTI